MASVAIGSFWSLWSSLMFMFDNMRWGEERGGDHFSAVAHCPSFSLWLQVPDVRGRHALVDAAEGAAVQLPPRRQLLGRPLRQGDGQRRQQQIRLLQVSQMQHYTGWPWRSGTWFCFLRFGCSTACPILPGLIRIGQKWQSSWARLSSF